MQRTPPFRILDAFRGFAALWIVVTHSAGHFLVMHEQYAQNSFFIGVEAGQLGVVLFFVISGYCIMSAAYSALLFGKPVTRFFRDRVRRIYPPYLAALILTVAFDLCLGQALKHHWIGSVHYVYYLEPTARYWAGNLLLLQGILNVPYTSIVFWSLAYEVSFYVLTGLLLLGAKLVKSYLDPQKSCWFLMLATAVSAMITLSQLITRGSIRYPFDLWHLFAIGSLLFIALEANSETIPGYSKRFQSTCWICVTVLSLLIAWFGIVATGSVRSVGHPSVRDASFTAILFCVCLIFLRKSDARLVQMPWLRPFLWIGTFSYSLYLFHPIAIPIIDTFLRKLGLDGRLYAITFVFAIAGSVATGYLMFHLVERHFISKRQVKRIQSELAANPSTVQV